MSLLSTQEQETLTAIVLRLHTSVFNDEEGEFGGQTYYLSHWNADGGLGSSIQTQDWMVTFNLLASTRGGRTLEDLTLVRGSRDKLVSDLIFVKMMFSK